MTRLSPFTPNPSTIAGPSVQAWVLPFLISWVHSQGGNAEAIRALPGIANLTDPDHRLPEASVEAAWRLAESLTHDEAVGVHLAEWLPRGALDLVEYAFRSSASLAAGFERLGRYGRVLSDRLALRVDLNTERLLLQFADAGSTALHPGRAEFALAAALKLARESTGQHITPLQVCFAHSQPGEDAEYRRFFGTPVMFGAGSTLMVLSSRDAARPLLGADEALLTIVRRRLDKTLANHRIEVGPFAERVRRLLVEQLGRSRLTPSDVAASFTVSRRTLSRKLEEEGTSFREILDDVHREYACALLHDRSLSVGDVAFFLHYSEPAAFHRAFRRWTGKTPHEFRVSASIHTP